MAAITVYKHKGLKVELWKTCFKVEGMSTVIFIKTEPDKKAINDLIDAVYDAVYHEAKAEAVLEVTNRVVHFVKAAIE